MKYDAILIHPPSFYDFRKQPIFPGPVAYTVGGSTTQFIMPPVGMLSIAEYLERNGFSARVDNIGERMLADPEFDVENYIAELEARVYSIGLHWCVHSQGAIEIARLCKQLHPEALVVIGGLTATVFHEESIQKFDFIDAVLRGEAEKPFVQLMKALDENAAFENVPNLTYRDSSGNVITNPLLTPDEDIDEYDFTRLDLLEPNKSIFVPGQLPSWVIPVCRGCLHNCVSCGGSAYSYRTHLGRQKPGFRSAEKIVEDLKKLSEQGIELVFLFQDPRMGGREYWTHLLKCLQQEDINLQQITMEIFSPVDEEFMQELAKSKVPIVLTISPESGVDTVRGHHGRKYTNEGLFQTFELCKKYGIRLGSFSMLALANDTEETIKKTWKSWDEIISWNTEYQVPIDYAFGPMILLDPGSLGFDRHMSYGYKLIFKDLEDYIEGMSQPSWHQWISYETKFLNREQIAQLTIDSLEYSIDLREKCGFFRKQDADMSRYWFVDVSKKTIAEVDEAMHIEDEAERLEKLTAFRESLYANQASASSPSKRRRPRK